MANTSTEYVKNRVASRLEKSRQPFQAEIASPQSFVTFRGLTFRSIPSAQEAIFGVNGYDECLPKFRSRDFTTLVTDEIEKRKSEREKSGKAYQQVTIADVGYGMGAFLLDCREKWGDDVELMGVGTDVYAKNPHVITLGNESATLEPTYDLLRKRGVRLIESNVVDIRNNLGDNVVDFIVSSNALSYVEYPLWELIKKLYRVLKPQGIALLDLGPLPPQDAIKDLQSIKRYLKEKGYEMEIGSSSLSFIKTHPDINLPVRTTNIGTPSEQIAIGGKTNNGSS